MAAHRHTDTQTHRHTDTHTQTQKAEPSGTLVHSSACYSYWFICMHEELKAKPLCSKECVQYFHFFYPCYLILIVSHDRVVGVLNVTFCDFDQQHLITRDQKF